MTPPILDDISTWFVDWSLITIMGAPATTPSPRKKIKLRTSRCAYSITSSARAGSQPESDYSLLQIGCCKMPGEGESRRSARLRAYIVQGWRAAVARPRPGGLRARLARQMRRGKPIHWHIDRLTEAGTVLGAWRFCAVIWSPPFRTCRSR
jgi:hypothetical protein